MRKLSILTMFLGFCLIPANAIAQDSYTQKRSQEIAASFSKEKQGVKDKHGVRSEKYKRVVSELALKQDVTAYSGEYEVPGFGHFLTIEVARDGSVKATGTEPRNGATRSFRLEGGKISGAMLTATKVYDDGATEKFEGAFINRTDYISPADGGSRAFGLGVVGIPAELAGVTVDRLFFQLKEN